MSTPWWGELSRAHWWVLIVAVLGWLFDAMDQRLFILARTPALRDLLPASAAGQLPAFAGWATGLFIAGWATGGLLFGLLGDRWGRVRTMTLTILVYSLFTGLSGLARSWPEFAAYRFLCWMGIGGEYAVGVGLVAETMPARARPFALGLVQAFSSVGAIIGSGLSLLVEPQTTFGQTAGWRSPCLVRRDPQPAGRADPDARERAGPVAACSRAGPVGGWILDQGFPGAGVGDAVGRLACHLR